MEEVVRGLTSGNYYEMTLTLMKARSRGVDAMCCFEIWKTVHGNGPPVFVARSGAYELLDDEVCDLGGQFIKIDGLVIHDQVVVRVTTASDGQFVGEGCIVIANVGEVSADVSYSMDLVVQGQFGQVAVGDVYLKVRLDDGGAFVEERHHQARDRIGRAQDALKAGDRTMLVEALLQAQQLLMRG